MYEDIFSDLDNALKNLGKSNSSIEYANHIRTHFDDVLYYLTYLKIETGNSTLVKEDDWYFE